MNINISLINNLLTYDEYTYLDEKYKIAILITNVNIESLCNMIKDNMNVYMIEKLFHIVSL